MLHFVQPLIVARGEWIWVYLLVSTTEHPSQFTDL